jgi:hypothetical protein
MVRKSASDEFCEIFRAACEIFRVSVRKISRAVRNFATPPLHHFMVSLKKAALEPTF